MSLYYNVIQNRKDEEMNNKFRIPCMHGCGRMVLKKLGAECRKCRRKRVHAGLKLIKRHEKDARAEEWREARANGNH